MSREASVDRSVQGWIECVRHCELEVPEPLRRGVAPHRASPGDGFDTALSYVLAHPEVNGLRLVHGLCLGIAHAWVELPGGIAFDGVVQRFYTLAGYRAAMAAAEEASYTAREAAHLVLAGDHCGPWTAEEVKGAVRAPAAAPGGQGPAGG